MAYSNVGTPVFYIDNYLYHKTIGTSIIPNTPEDIFTLSPATSSSYAGTGSATPSVPIYLPVNTNNYDFNGNMKYYFAFLNHSSTILGIGANTNLPMTITEVLNVTEVGGGDSTFNAIMPLKGSTIFTTTTTGISFFNITSFSVGAISIGIQYTMPHSPDLKLSMEIEMDGVDTITTSGGGIISDIKHTGNPLWVNGANKTNPFEVYGGSLDVTSTGAIRHGRKSWDLKFSYISDTDLFSSNPRASNYTDHGFANDTEYSSDDVDTTNNILNYNMETDDSFYAQVWNKTLGGVLPFIFQPDSNHRDDFYICKFDQDSLKASQVANKVYDISLKIVESW